MKNWPSLRTSVATIALCGAITALAAVAAMTEVVHPRKYHRLGPVDPSTGHGRPVTRFDRVVSIVGTGTVAIAGGLITTDLIVKRKRQCRR